MFGKIKRNLFKFFGKKNKSENIEDHSKKEVIEIKSDIKEEVKPVIRGEDNYKLRLKRKLLMIIKHTKSKRIKKKNLKRLVKLYEKQKPYGLN